VGSLSIQFADGVGHMVVPGPPGRSRGEDNYGNYRRPDPTGDQPAARFRSLSGRPSTNGLLGVRSVLL
jgi:hypothetical protein